MDTEEMARRKFYDLLLTNFPTQFDGAWDNDTQVKLENQKFAYPVDLPYLAAYMIFTQAKPASIGTLTKFDRHCGFFCIECQVPADTGMKTLWLMVGAAARIFDRIQTTLDDGSYLSTGVHRAYQNTSQDGQYFVTVMVPFDIDTCGY